ncbi:SDR family oxidoreductase [Vibrio sp. CAIM 722]|uniref:SDR family oxidoreductase n=1 Tax=Vibrio eleionomae TaxID=2653505 RepID=A0A7X4LMD1_9VIBR|nr:SDR family oxidoreductase [Vibrio eleionomae]MZI94421.1 SDR family oxidoreductase [Vibrio eleionomae]
MNKIALITGGSRGLGKSTALHLAKHHIGIIVTYHSDKQAAQEVITEIEQLGGKAFALQCDIRDVAKFAEFSRQLKLILGEHFERQSFDYLVNNAGTGLHQMMKTTTVSDLDDMLNIHVKGPFFFTQTLLPLINNGGHIVNISSGLARFTFPGSGAYAMAKGAVEVMTRYMAKEFANQGIRVNTLAPGAIATDFRGGAIRDSQQAQAMVASVTALGRVGEADDIGKAISALLSDGLDWVTGQRIEVSGGMML